MEDQVGGHTWPRDEVASVDGTGEGGDDGDEGSSVEETRKFCLGGRRADSVSDGLGAGGWMEDGLGWQCLYWPGVGAANTSRCSTGWLGGWMTFWG